MRVALVRQRYNPFGGAERFVERALCALFAQGVGVTLITREWSGPEDQPTLICNPFYVGRLWRDWSFARCVRKTQARERFDIVQSHERVPGCDVYRAGDGVHATWLEQRGRARGAAAVIVSALSPWHRYTLGAEARTFQHPRLRAVICNSHMVREDIRARYGVPVEKLYVVHNGVDLELFHPVVRSQHRAKQRAALGLSDSTPLFLYVGSGFERKGVPQLIDALAAMSNKQAVLLIVGRDGRQSRMERRARRRGLAGRVLFAGGHKDVRPFYGAADAFVLPTLYDPFPNAALEALACGLPVVTSTSCGAAELVRDGINGYVCDALDVGTLARHLDTLAASGVAARMSVAARASVADLSLPAMAERLIALYRALLVKTG